MNLILKSLPAPAFAAALGLAGQAAAAGHACGGPAGRQCPATQYCKLPADACPTPGAAGVCETKPQMCNELYQPVCGCDGKTYANECHAQREGVGIASQGACAKPVSPSNPGG